MGRGGAQPVGGAHLEGTLAPRGWFPPLSDLKAQELELVKFIFHMGRVPKVSSQSPHWAISAYLCWTS